jgi:orotidine-5'-phosphate decarboxylase
MRFFERLQERIAAVDSVVSVGLDPVPDRLPADCLDRDLPRWAFNRRIIDATHDHAAAYKPNAAFYEDADGWRALAETIAYAHGKDVPVVLDAKRGDVGHTARQYARVLDESGLDADAITVSPYLGRDSLQPFLDRDAGVFVLCRTSNAGGADIQALDLDAGDALYERVASLAETWDPNGTVGLVVGATAPDELERLRDRVPGLPFLVPGVGAQGGDAEAAVEHGLAARDGDDGRPEVGLINSLRGVIYAAEEHGGAGEDIDAYARAAGEAVKRLKGRLNAFR